MVLTILELLLDELINYRSSYKALFEPEIFAIKI